VNLASFILPFFSMSLLLLNSMQRCKGSHSFCTKPMIMVEASFIIDYFVPNFVSIDHGYIHGTSHYFVPNFVSIDHGECKLLFMPFLPVLTVSELKRLRLQRGGFGCRGEVGEEPWSTGDGGCDRALRQRHIAAGGLELVGPPVWLQLPEAQNDCIWYAKCASMQRPNIHGKEIV
jgi:hypothetical protein